MLVLLSIPVDMSGIWDCEGIGILVSGWMVSIVWVVVRTVLVIVVVRSTGDSTLSAFV